jgi:cell division septal protein FtsQ
MWFSSKKRNRRHERDYTLKVKMRANEVLATRVSKVARGLAVFTAMALIFFFGWRGGEWALDEFVYSNEAFALERMDIQTDGIIPLDLLKRWSGVKPGDNLLALDLGRVKRDLELVPLIEFASVERILPHDLKVRVTEREPVAQIFVIPNSASSASQAPVLFQLDASGYAMIPLANSIAGSREGSDWLPTLTGLKSSELLPGRKVESKEVQAALALITRFEKSPMFGLADIRSIDVSVPQILQARTGQGGEVTLNMGNLDNQLRRWRLIHDLGHRTNKTIASLDLAVSNYVPVQWLEASLAPAFKPSLPKLSRYRKKHV